MGCGPTLFLPLFHTICFIAFPKILEFKGAGRCSTKIRCCSAVLTGLMAVLTTWHSLKQSGEQNMWEELGFNLHGSVSAVTFPSLLLLLLYSGQLLMMYMDGYFESFSKFLTWNCTFEDANWIKNIIVAPVTEEIIFRSCMTAILTRCYSLSVVYFIGPLIFATSHLNLLSEDLFKGKLSLKEVLSKRAFQFVYTFLFGVYTSYLFSVTKNILSPVITHILCNILGTPMVAEIQYYPHVHQRLLLWLTYFLGLFIFLQLFCTLTQESLYR